VPDPDPNESAATLHQTLLEVLKQLNRAEVEEPEGEGLETHELLTLLKKGPLPALVPTDLDHALDTLVVNRLAAVADAEVYAWDRGRTMGRRFLLTVAGKEYLLSQLEKVGRV
jgi:hypothetical protein